MIIIWQISWFIYQWRHEPVPIQDFAGKEVNPWVCVEDLLDVKIYAKNCTKIYNAVVHLYGEVHLRFCRAFKRLTRTQTQDSGLMTSLWFRTDLTHSLNPEKMSLKIITWHTTIRHTTVRKCKDPRIHESVHSLKGSCQKSWFFKIPVETNLHKWWCIWIMHNFQRSFDVWSNSYVLPAILILSLNFVILKTSLERQKKIKYQ